ncbi:MAG: LOG family protein [Gemmatimonadota bacterium]|nr:LOG family protein [Gemmatimonadota bacterium]
MPSPLVAVFGSGSGTSEDLRRARALGSALASAGYGVINGGYGGTMEASARGAREAGGDAVGVTCAAFTFRSGANPHVCDVVEAATLIARMEELIHRASAYVVLPGGNGTLAELAVTWEHLRKGLLDGERPLVAWEEPWRRVLAPLVEGPHLPGGEEGIVWVDTVAEAVAAVESGVGASEE